MPFGFHEDPQLQDRFRDKPWQGQNPEKAEKFFVTLDANFPADFHTARNLREDYKRYLLYKDKPIESWMANAEQNPTNVHHPFLVPGCQVSKGRQYHRGIGNLIQGQETKICFLELLEQPTWGTSEGSEEFRNEVLSDHNRPHLNRLKRWIAGKPAFFSCGMYTLLLEQRSDIFDTLTLRRISVNNPHFAITHPSRYNTVPNEWALLLQQMNG